MEDLIFIKTAQMFIASIRYEVLALLGLNVDIGSIYISRKSTIRREFSNINICLNNFAESAASFINLMLVREIKSMLVLSWVPHRLCQYLAGNNAVQHHLQMDVAVSAFA